jgi:hypothetical protein
MMTVVVKKSDVEIVARLGHEYLRTCKVAEWMTIKDGRWAPKAWHVPVEAVEQSKVDPTFRIVYAEDEETAGKLGLGYLRTCKVAAWSVEGFPSAWIVPAEVLDLPEVAYERRSVYKGDVAAVRKLGQDFLKYCPIGDNEWSVPIFVLDQLGIVPLDREEADEVRQRMSKSQHDLNRSKYPEKVIAEEWLDLAVERAPEDGDLTEVLWSICEFLASKDDQGFFWLPRKMLADKLECYLEDLNLSLRVLKTKQIITGIATRGRLKIFKFLGPGFERLEQDLRELEQVAF